MGRKNWLPTVQQRGHWRPRSWARELWEGEEGGGKSTRRAGTVIQDWVIALPGFEELGRVNLERERDEGMGHGRGG